METFDTDQPWVVYRFGATHDGWWPLWSSTRVLGYAVIVCECAVCGRTERLRIRMPRFADLPDRGHHPARAAFLAEHAHPDRGHPMSWAKPLLNWAAHPGGVNLDMLGMRLGADMNERDQP